MRSRMEAEFAAHLDDLLDRLPEVFESWEYEPMCFASPAGQYLPDFLLNFTMHDGVMQQLYVETKPIVDDFEPIADRMEIIWESEPGVGLAIYELRGEQRGWTGIRGAWWFEPADTEKVRVR